MKKFITIPLLILIVISISACNLIVKEAGSSTQGAMFPVITDELKDFSSSSTNEIMQGEELTTEQKQQEEPLLPFAKSATNELWGYIDAKTGEYVIPPMFERYGPFDKAGYAWVGTKDLIGLIDKTGKYVIEPKYKYIYSFTSKDRALVKDKNDIWLIIDRAGNTITELLIDKVHTVLKDQEIALVSLNDILGYIDINTGAFIVPLGGFEQDNK